MQVIYCNIYRSTWYDNVSTQVVCILYCYLLIENPPRTNIFALQILNGIFDCEVAVSVAG